MLTLTQLNGASQALFTEWLGALYEHSPWVAEIAADARPFADLGRLRAALAAAVRRADHDRQLALIRAHPDLAGKLARAGGLGTHSASEQAGLGLDRLSDAEFDRFDGLNRAYRGRFGFPFITALRLATRSGILAAFEQRLLNDDETEIETALAEIDKIAALRLADLVADVPAEALAQAAVRPASLGALEDRVRLELSYLDYPAKEWVPPRTADGRRVLDVLIVGAGQGGLATAFGLLREKVNNILVVDRAPEGLEGPWTTFARMVTLRTPKHVSGPDLGVASLTPRAWYEARLGATAWDCLGKIPRELWQEYLGWYRRVLNLPVRNEVDIVGIEPGQGVLTARLGNGDRLLARKIVLATGIEGSGRWHVPDFITALPPDRHSHTSGAIDFTRLRGRRVGVLGAGASAFDNAATALEAGARSVDLCIRRRSIPRINPYRWMEQAGFLGSFADLPDEQRWRYARHIFALNQPPPQDTVRRCTAFESFRIHMGTPWLDARMQEDEIRVEAPGGSFMFDYVIVGTGFLVDASLRPELAGIAGEIATWKDRYTPPLGEESEVLASYPYLGRAFEFTEKNPEQAPFLRDIHNFTFGATPSMGLSGASISGMKYGVKRLVDGLTRDLFRADAEAHYRDLVAYADPELTDWTYDVRSPSVPGSEESRPAGAGA